MKSSGKKRKVTLFIANMTLVLFSAFIASIIFDRLLIFVGLPNEKPKIYAHPPNFTQERSSIDFRYTVTELNSRIPLAGYLKRNLLAILAELTSSTED